MYSQCISSRFAYFSYHSLFSVPIRGCPTTHVQAQSQQPTAIRPIAIGPVMTGGAVP
ncbi:hypothetical protein BCR44DRAFT_1454496, partial [Catenaria anguillulae PL171]